MKREKIALALGLLLYAIGLALLVLGVLLVLSLDLFSGSLLLGFSTLFCRIGIQAVNMHVAVRILGDKRA